MITKGDMDKVLVDVNRILAGIDARVASLEKLNEEAIPVKSTTSIRTPIKKK